MSSLRTQSTLQCYLDIRGKNKNLVTLQFLDVGRFLRSLTWLSVSKCKPTTFIPEISPRLPKSSVPSKRKLSDSVQVKLRTYEVDEIRICFFLLEIGPSHFVRETVVRGYPERVTGTLSLSSHGEFGPIKLKMINKRIQKDHLIRRTKTLYPSLKLQTPRWVGGSS